MADNLNIVLGTKIDDGSKSIVEINKQITDLSTKIKSLKINIDVDDKIIQALHNKIDNLRQQFNLNLAFNTNNKDITETAKNVKKIGDEVDNSNKKLLAHEKYFNSISKTVLTLRENISNLSITKGLDLNSFESDFDKIQSLMFNMKNMNVESDAYAQAKVDLDGIIKNVQYKLTLDKNQLNQLKKQEDIYTRINKQLAILKDVTVKNDKYDVKQYGELVDAHNKIKTAVDNNTMSFSKADTELKKLSTTTKDFEVNAKKASNTTNAFSATFSRFLSYFTIYKTIELTRRVITEMVSAVTKLDTAMYNIQMVTGGTRKETEQLMLSYNKLGKELGATTLEVSTSANEFLRQGKSISETNTLIKNAMILSKVGMISSADATSYLTSAMKGFNVEASNSIDIIDKLSAVDVESATSAGGIAEAMSRTASSARLAGIEMDRLIGYIALVGEVTQKDMASVGESFKTIFSRMGNVKLGQPQDEDGNDITTQISDVEKVLDKVNIKLRSSATEFRNFGDVLDDVGKNWKSFNDVEKNAIATTFAGMRQRENFLVLMDGYGQALKYSETSLNSAGTAMKKFEIYQESIEAKTNKLRTAFELLATKTLNSGLIKGIVDLSTEILTLINNMGGLIPILTSVGLIWLGWKTSLLPSIITQFKAIVLAQGGMITSSVMASAAQLGLAGSIQAVGLAIKSVLLTNPAGWVLLAVGAIASVIGVSNKLKDSVIETRESINTLSTELKDLQDEQSSIKSLGEKYISLKGIDNKTTEQWNEFYSIQEQLHELLPDLNGYVDEQGNFIINNVDSLTDLVSIQNEYIRLKREELALASKENMGNNINSLEKERKALTYYQSLLNSKHTLGLPDSEIENVEKKIKEIANNIKQYTRDMSDDILKVATATQTWGNLTEDEANAIRKAYSNLSNDKKEEYAKQIENNTFKTQEFIKTLLSTDVAKDVLKKALDNATNSADQLATSFTSVESSIKKLSDARSNIEDLQKVLDNLNENNKLSASDMESLIAMSEEFIPYLNDEIALRQKLSDSINKYKDDYQTSYNEMLKTSSTYYDEKIKGDDELRTKLEKNISEYFKTINLEYNGDLKRYSDLENAKAKITVDVIKQVAGEWRKYFDASGNLISSLVSSSSDNKLLSPLFSKAELQQMDSLFNQGLQNIESKIQSAMLGYDKIIGDIVYEPIDLKFDTDSSKKDKKDKHLEAFQEEYDKLKYLRDMEIISTQEYYDKLDALNKKYLVGKSKYAKEERQLNLELYNLARTLSQERIQDFEFRVSVLEFNGGEATKDKQIAIYKQMQDEVHKMAQHARAMGLDENNDYIQQLRSQWMDYASSITDLESKAYSKLNKSFDDRNRQIELQQQLVNDGSVEYLELEQQKYDIIIAKETAMQKEIIRLQSVGTNQAKEQAEQLIDTYYNLAEERYNIIKNLQSNQISIYQNQIDELEKQKDALQDIHDFTIQMIKYELNAKKKLYQDEIDQITKVFNAKKNALRDEQDTRNYERGLTEKSAVVADLENQLALIKNDETAIAKRKKLEEDLAKAKQDLADYQYDHSIDLQEKALDKQLEMETDKLDKEIDLIDETLSNEAKMREETNKRIEKSGEKLKKQLINHAREVGTFTEEEVTNAWKVAGEAVVSFDDKQKNLLSTLRKITDELVDTKERLEDLQDMNLKDYADTIGKNTNSNTINDKNTKIAQMQANSEAWKTANPNDKLKLANENQKIGKELGLYYDAKLGAWFYDKQKKLRVYHSGGIVGGSGSGYVTKDTEELAKLLKGELVITPPQASAIMDNITNNNSESFNPTFIFQFEGNADSSLLEQFKKEAKTFANIVAEEMDKSRSNTGYKKKFKRA